MIQENSRKYSVDGAGIPGMSKIGGKELLQKIPHAIK